MEHDNGKNENIYQQADGSAPVRQESNAQGWAPSEGGQGRQEDESQTSDDVR